MPPLPASTFARKFRWLRGSQQRALLADLWAARGFDTRVDEDAGVVVANRDGETVEIGVVGPLALSTPDADVLVATRSVGRAESVAQATGAELLTPADLREQLLYGVERDVGERLAREHLDTGLAVQSARDDPGVDRSRLVVLAAFVVGVGAVVAISGVGGPFAEQDAEQFPTPEPATAGTESPPTTSTPSDGVLDAYPPGLNASGVVNASDLAAAHRDAIENRQRRIETTYRGPANTTTLPDIVHHEVTGNFHSPGRFNATFRVVELQNGSPANRTVRYWADGSNRHRLVESGNETRYSRSPLSGRSIVVAVEGFVNRIYAGALAANETRVETVTQSDITVHRITAVEDPEGYRDDLTEFRAVAVITDEGRLLRLEVTYTHVPTGEPVHIEVAYSRFRDVPPPPQPEWVRENQ